MGVSRDCPNFLSTPIISGTGKATNFKFGTHILSIDRNKSPLQISGKLVGCAVRTLKTFQGTHILGASRGLLCDSSAVLFCHGAIFFAHSHGPWTRVPTASSSAFTLLSMQCRLSLSSYLVTACYCKMFRGTHFLWT